MISSTQIWQWLAEVPDPEIPIISVVDLGIVRDVRWDNDEWVVAVTPTYSGCPATIAISEDIKSLLNSRGVDALRLETQLSPPWTTDWISEAGKARLREFGIAPPVPRTDAPIECPRCSSTHTEKVSEFGSTPCKAQYRCSDCLEPFDYLKCL
jgi:ring-1,2-phenylacetyl-CoA epoxidase subunit PaaD